jgi:hypothetical protein
MGNRVYLNQSTNTFVVLSYAGGTKYFHRLTETVLKNYVTVDGKNIEFEHELYSVIQVVREPVSRYMSWFDKQYIKPMWKSTDVDFVKWSNRLITKQWIDNFFEQARHYCHYDGHTNFQSIWPKFSLAAIWREDWQYLKMSDINPYFLKQPSIDLFRDPKEYVGVWESLEPTVKDYALKKIEDLYATEIEWYNNLNFIKID